jgi:hypothetical protein
MESSPSQSARVHLTATDFARRIIEDLMDHGRLDKITSADFESDSGQIA